MKFLCKVKCCNTLDSFRSEELRRELHTFSLNEKNIDYRWKWMEHAVNVWLWYGKNALHYRPRGRTKYETCKESMDWSVEQEQAILLTVLPTIWSRFTSRERAPGTHCTGGWVDPRVVLDAVVKRKILSPRRESNPSTLIVRVWIYPTIIISPDSFTQWIWCKMSFRSDFASEIFIVSVDTENINTRSKTSGQPCYKAEDADHTISSTKHMKFPRCYLTVDWPNLHIPHSLSPFEGSHVFRS
jgi:hypothetical protein